MGLLHFRRRYDNFIAVKVFGDGLLHRPAGYMTGFEQTLDEFDWLIVVFGESVSPEPGHFFLELGGGGNFNVGCSVFGHFTPSMPTGRHVTIPASDDRP